MRFKKWVVASIAVVFLTIANTVGAVVIEADLSTVGDGLLTRDTETGLEWLDLTETLNIGRNDIAAGAGGFLPDLGFRFDQGNEFGILLDHIGVLIREPACQSGFRDDLEAQLCFPGFATLLDLLGCTIRCDTTQPGAIIVDVEAGTETDWSIDTVHRTAAVGGDGAAGPAGRGEAEPVVGTLLVRSFIDIPEPPTYILFFIGLTLITSRMRCTQK